MRWHAAASKRQGWPPEEAAWAPRIESSRSAGDAHLPVPNRASGFKARPHPVPNPCSTGRRRDLILSDFRQFYGAATDEPTGFGGRRFILSALAAIRSEKRRILPKGRPARASARVLGVTAACSAVLRAISPGSERRRRLFRNSSGLACGWGWLILPPSLASIECPRRTATLPARCPLSRL